MTRLKWYKFDTFYATDDILASNDCYWACINVPNMYTTIINGDLESVVYKKCKNLKSAKAWAKKELVKLGMIVYDEVRNRRR